MLGSFCQGVFVREFLSGSFFLLHSFETRQVIINLENLIISMTGRLWHVPVYFTILKLSDIMSVNSFLSVMILSKLTHYVDLGIFCQNRTKNHFSEIISNQSCSPTLDRKEHRGWTISYENSLLKVCFISHLTAHFHTWPPTSTQDRPI